MPWIKSKKNGNALYVEDVDHARTLLAEGHDAFKTDPRLKGVAKKWDPDVDGDEDVDSGDDND